MIRAIVTDIEGTTTSISFVKEILFPYARERLPRFVREQGGVPEVRAQLDEARRILEDAEASDEAITAHLQAWIDQDRKLTPLKSLQGMIWEEGYRCGDLRGHVYPDAPAQLARWHEQGIALYVFSSGSVQAQRLLFGFSEAGDLTPLFSGYFDTRIGAKGDARSYRAIAAEIRVQPEEMLFLSDLPAELDAARDAGLATCQVLRPGTPKSANFNAAETFSQVVLPF